MKVTTAGDALQVSIKKPLTATGRVTVWRKDHELQVGLFLFVGFIENTDQNS